MTDDEIDKLGAGNNYPGTVPGMRKFAREIIAAHTAKLLAGVEMPEYKYIDRHDVPKEGMCVYTQDQLQSYAAAAAAPAREQALEQCRIKVTGLSVDVERCKQLQLTTQAWEEALDAAANAIEQLKESK